MWYGLARIAKSGYSLCVLRVVVRRVEHAAVVVSRFAAEATVRVRLSRLTVPHTVRAVSLHGISRLLCTPSCTLLLLHRHRLCRGPGVADTRTCTPTDLGAHARKSTETQ